MRGGLLLLAGFLALATPALAKPIEKSSTTYFKIQGSTAPEVHASLLRNTPRLSKRLAYAMTSVTAKVNGDKQMKGKTCTYKTLTVRTNYVFILPKHSSPGSMDAATRSQWQSFSASLKAHEEQHRSFWRECLADLEADARDLSARDCNGLEKKLQKRLLKARAECLRRDVKLDQNYSRTLLRDPFVRAAFKRGEGKGRNLFATFGRKKKPKAN